MFVATAARSLRDEAVSRGEWSGITTVRTDGFRGNAPPRRDRAVAVQAPLPARMDGGPTGTAEWVVTRGAPLDGHLRGDGRHGRREMDGMGVAS